MYSQYLRKRGYRSTNDAAFRMIFQSLSQPSFPLFWRYWNPFVAFVLHLFYRHSRPNRPASIVLTFVLSGFIFHDLLIYLFFGFFSLGFTISFLFYSFVNIGIGKERDSLFRLCQRSVAAAVLLNLLLIMAGLFVGFFFSSVVFQYPPFSQLNHLTTF